MPSNVLDIAAFPDARTRELQQLNLLLARLECDDSETRRQAIASLHQLANRLREQPGSFNSFRLFRLDLTGLPRPLSLLLHEAVFEPEDWSRTFAEALLRQPQIFDGKTVVEVGTGSGWVSIALLLTSGARHICGLDLNPIAALVARLNAWLNGTTPDGSFVFAECGLPLPEAFTVSVSDLLQLPLARRQKFDHMIGCIPQVLHPDPHCNSRSADSADDLYDLSNYCFAQGVLEDRFGLPLIARALDEAKQCLNPSALITLVLGGRPGMTVIENMFRRRGYDTRVLSTRRIPQAQDTNISSLVELERAYDIQFHFYTCADSKQSISASAAQELLASGVCPYHDLFVVQAAIANQVPAADQPSQKPTADSDTTAILSTTAAAVAV